MSKKYTIGDYQYSELTIGLGTILLLAGIIYGIATHKTAITTILLASIASVAGACVGMIITAPKIINE